MSIVSLREWSSNERAMRQRRPLPGSALPRIVAVVIAIVAVVALVISAFGTTR